MGFILRFIKNCFLWTYARNTWQWDVLCVVILVFIFLSPKSWFVNSERAANSGHQKAVSTVVLGPESLAAEMDQGQLEQRVRVILGRPEAQVEKVRPVRDEAGKTLRYEVDIR
jgi:hypothetical protein